METSATPAVCIRWSVLCYLSYQSALLPMLLLLLLSLPTTNNNNKSAGGGVGIIVHGQILRNGSKCVGESAVLRRLTMMLAQHDNQLSVVCQEMWRRLE